MRGRQTPASYRLRAPIRAPSEDLGDSLQGRIIQAETDVGTLFLEPNAELVTAFILQRGCYGPELAALLRSALRPGMTFVDAGANIGYFSVLAAKLVGDRGRVFAVEPDERNLAILEANLSHHNCTNATILPIAAWSERADLSIRPNPQGGAGVAVATNEPELSRIPAARLDQVIDGRVDVLKVDCEATDHLVVSGAEELFRANPAMVITVEFFPRSTSHTGHTAAQVLESYRALGLRPYEIAPVEEAQHGSALDGRLRPTTFQRLLNADPPGSLPMFDFALSPEALAYLLAGRGLRVRAREALPEAWRRPYLRQPRTARARRALLERAGDALEYVPEKWRPPIRHRDRQADEERSI